MKISTAPSLPLFQNTPSATQYQPISAVIITKNEERNIARCIDSLRQIADEIIVVDSYSTDATQAICEARGVRFIQHPFEGHIQQKNYALTQASHDYVLSLDADEALDDTLREAILQVKQDCRYDGYQMRRLTNFGGKWVRYGSWYPDRKLRLWNRHKGKWGGLNPHDKFEMHPEALITTLPGNLLHYSFYCLEEYIRQMDKFARISAQSYFAEGKQAGWFKLYGSPMVSFLKGYFWKGGFRLGFTGFLIATTDAHFSFLKYAYLRELQVNYKKTRHSQGAY